MAIRLTYNAETSVPVEIEGFTTDWACDKSMAELERFEIFHGNCKIPMAEMFTISGDASDKCMEFEGNLSGVHWIGAHMESGLVRIHGNAGRHVGSQMRGGKIIVDGDARGWVGSEMHQGLIHIKGNAGHLTGSAYRGSSKGMTGGTILIDGNAGNEIGLTMRRGMIAIGGTAGDMLGFNMIAGTVVVFGECGIRPGAGMRRGTLALLGENPPQLLPSFRHAATYQPQFMKLMLRSLIDKGFGVHEDLMGAEIDLYHGDLVALGRGEIWFRHDALSNRS
jgi:formylmethanofuran dehydrogenase subunit C